MSGTQHPSGGREHAPAAHPAATPAPPFQAQAPAPVPLGHASSVTEPLPPSGAQAPRRKPAKPKPPKKAKPARARRKGTTARRKAKRPSSRRRRGGRRWVEFPGFVDGARLGPHATVGAAIHSWSGTRSSQDRGRTT